MWWKIFDKKKREWLGYACKWKAKGPLRRKALRKAIELKKEWIFYGN